MKVLVTGATGFVGAALARRLVQSGVRVRVLVRAGSDTGNIEGLGIERASGDLLDASSCERALDGCRRLYHVAAHYALWARDPGVFYRVNVNGTRTLLDAARSAGIERVVYTSTVGALGIPTDGTPGNEETPVALDQLVGHYKRSKYLAECEVRSLAEEGLPVVIVNPSAPIGPRDIKPTPTGQLIVDFMKGRMKGYLETGLNLVDVDDVAAGHMLAMEKGTIGERYILGHQNMTLSEIFTSLSRICGRKPPRFKIPYGVALSLAHLNTWMSDAITHRTPMIPVEGVRMAKRYMFFDCSKAVQQLGVPQCPIDVALEKAVRWFRDHRYA